MPSIGLPDAALIVCFEGYFGVIQPFSSLMLLIFRFSFTKIITLVALQRLFHLSYGTVCAMLFSLLHCRFHAAAFFLQYFAFRHIL